MLREPFSLLEMPAGHSCALAPKAAVVVRSWPFSLLAMPAGHSSALALLFFCFDSVSLAYNKQHERRY